MALTLGLAACGDDEPADTAQAPTSPAATTAETTATTAPTGDAAAEIAEQGFTQSGTTVLIGAVLRNPGDVPLTGVTITASLQDGQGDEIESVDLGEGGEWQTVTLLPAGAELPVGEDVAVAEGATVETVRLEVTAADEDPTAEATLATVSGVTVTSETTTLGIEGTLVNESDEPFGSADSIDVVLRGADGQILGGFGSGGIVDEDVAPGAEAPFETSFALLSEPLPAESAEIGVNYTGAA